jgi:ATP-dependent DNA ligase
LAAIYATLNTQLVKAKKSMNPAYRPMLATLVNEPFDDKEWVFETKWDGFRLITEKGDQTVRLWSRNGIDVSIRYAVLLPALQKIKGSCVIDGELCVLDAHRRLRFQLLQNALNKKAKLLYVVFDTLFAGGKEIRKKPLLARKEILIAFFFLGGGDGVIAHIRELTDLSNISPPKEFDRAARWAKQKLAARRRAE